MDDLLICYKEFPVRDSKCRGPKLKGCVSLLVSDGKHQMVKNLLDEVKNVTAVTLRKNISTAERTRRGITYSRSRGEFIEAFYVNDNPDSHVCEEVSPAGNNDSDELKETRIMLEQSKKEAMQWKKVQFLLCICCCLHVSNLFYPASTG